MSQFKLENLHQTKLYNDKIKKALSIQSQVNSLFSFSSFLEGRGYIMCLHSGITPDRVQGTYMEQEIKSRLASCTAIESTTHMG